MANWRSVFTGKGVSAARRADLVAAIEGATTHKSSLRTLQHNRWIASWMTGKDLEDFMALDAITASVMVYLLKLKA